MRSFYIKNRSFYHIGIDKMHHTLYSLHRFSLYASRTVSALLTYIVMIKIKRNLMSKKFITIIIFIVDDPIYLFFSPLVVQIIKFLERKYNPHLRIKTQSL